MAKLEFGVFDEFQVNFFSEVPEPVDHYEKTVREVQLEEELGFRYHFAIEHQNSNVGQCQSPTVYLSALAQRTNTIRIGTMIFQLPFHNPIRLAQDVAMVDQLSRGRIEFGAGVGVRASEFLRWNLPYPERRAMATEALEIIEKAWTQEIVTYEGKYWQFNEAIPVPRPYQNPHPPIWFGGGSRTSIEFTAAHNYNIGVGQEPDEMVAESLSLWRRLWKDAGHKTPMPRVLFISHVYVAETDEQAKEEVAPYLVQFHSWGEERVKQSRIGAPRGDDTPDRVRRAKMFQDMTTGVDYWLENGLAHVGSPETVLRRIEKQHQLMGFDIFVGRFRWGPIPDELVEKSMRLFGEKMMPAFA